MGTRLLRNCIMCLRRFGKALTRAWWIVSFQKNTEAAVISWTPAYLGSRTLPETPGHLPGSAFEFCGSQVNCVQFFVRPNAKGINSITKACNTGTNHIHCTKSAFSFISTYLITSWAMAEKCAQYLLQFLMALQDFSSHGCLNIVKRVLYSILENSIVMELNVIS